MPAAHIRAVNHTSFTVADLDAAVAFFTEGLGFDLLSKAPRDPKAIRHITAVADADIMVAYLQAPGHRLELIEYLAPAEKGRNTARPCDTGFAHLAFDVSDMDSALAAAEAHGVLPLNPPYVIDQGPNAGRQVVYLHSDNGMALEFIEVGNVEGE